MAGNKEVMRQAMEELLNMGGRVPGGVAQSTLIGPDAVFVGDLRAEEGDVTVQGRLKGSLTAGGRVRISGKVLGDVTAQEVTLDADGMVIGNVTCDRFISWGKLKGGLKAVHAATLRQGAVLLGDLSAGSVQIEEGACHQGSVVRFEE